jgi:hypothetical protein
MHARRRLVEKDQALGDPVMVVVTVAGVEAMVVDKEVVAVSVMHPKKQLEDETNHTSSVSNAI